MYLNRILSVVLILAVLSLAWGCAGSRAPRGWLSVPSKAQSEPYGGWITVYSSSEKNKILADGELIAVEAESLFVLQGAELVSLAWSDVAKAQLMAYDSKKGGLAVWATCGAFSTASHGWAAGLSLPLWIIIGTTTTASQSHAPNYTYPSRSWEEIKMFSRFPQGLPEGLDRSKILPKFSLSP